MLEIIITSSLLIVIILILRFVLRGKLSPKIIYAMWAIAAVRLLVPVSIAETSISVMNLFSPKESVQLDYTYESSYGDTTEDTYYFPEYDLSQNVTENQNIYATENPDTAVQNSDVSARNILRTIWLSGTAIVLVYIFMSNMLFYLFLRKKRTEVWSAECKLPLYLVDGIDSPCMFGLIRPSIYLSSFAFENEQRKKYIIAHELTHFHHLDHIWAVVRVLCVALHWFNPLVWAAAHLSKQDCELACDSDAIRTLGEEHRFDYGRTLIDMINTRFRFSEAMMTSTAMTSNAKSIRRRIQMLRITPKNVVWAIIAVIIIISIAVGCTFTGAASSINEDMTVSETDMAEENMITEEGSKIINMEDFPDLLGTPYTSYYEGDYLARSHNLELAARLIDGTVLQPGEEFSFNETVGERTEERGFVEAKLYPGEAEAEQYGGGIAQTAGTLFNAAFLADLEITQHFTHLYSVTYLEQLGTDASVTWGIEDLCFVNTTAYPIIIRMEYNNNSLTASIYGTAEDSGRSVELKAVEQDIVAYNVVFRPGETENISISGKYGSRIAVYRILWENGRMAANEIAYIVTYLPQNQIIYTDELPKGYEYYIEYSPDEAIKAYNTMHILDNHYPESDVEEIVTGLSYMKAEDIWSIPELQYLLEDIPVFESGKVGLCFHYLKGVENYQDDIVLGLGYVPQMDMIIMRIEGISPQIVEEHIEKLHEAGFTYIAETYDNYFYNAPAYGTGIFYEFHGNSEVQLTIFQQGDNTLGRDPVPKG